MMQDYYKAIETRLEFWTAIIPLERLTLVVGSPPQQVKDQALDHFKLTCEGVTIDERWLVLKEVAQ